MNERCQAEAKKNRKKELSEKSRISSRSVRVTARSCGSFLGEGKGAEKRQNWIDKEDEGERETNEEKADTPGIPRSLTGRKISRLSKFRRKMGQSDTKTLVRLGIVPK